MYLPEFYRHHFNKLTQSYHDPSKCFNSYTKYYKYDSTKKYDAKLLQNIYNEVETEFIQLMNNYNKMSYKDKLSTIYIPAINAFMIVINIALFEIYNNMNNHTQTNNYASNSSGVWTVTSNGYTITQPSSGYKVDISSNWYNNCVKACRKNNTVIGLSEVIDKT